MPESLTIDPTGQPAILTAFDNAYLGYGPPVDRFGMTDFAWDATARLRYCRAYCSAEPSERVTQAGYTSLFGGSPKHNPSCAYATSRWIQDAIATLKRVNRGW